MSSKVYFIDFKSYPGHNILDKLESLIITAGLHKIFKENELVACKLHFGEMGNVNFINPVYIKKIVEIIKKYKAIPFLTDTVTLYRGERSNAVTYLSLIDYHGFNFAPVIIADGLRGEYYFNVKINGKHFNEISVAGHIYNCDNLLIISHFKGHMVAGFGGAIKNLGMGCSSRKGKLAQHSNVSPIVKEEKCIGCGSCIKWCPSGAIEMAVNKAKISKEKCIGCATCLEICQNNAIDIIWNDDSVILQEKMTEYAFGIVKDKNVGYINFLENITPWCDCYPATDPHIAPDIGILASFDPVAIDTASYDLVNKATDGKFKKVNQNTFPEVQLDYGEKIGLGTKDYELIEVK